MALLVILEKGQPHRLHAIQQKTTALGRAEDADLQLPHPSVSRQHAQIHRDRGGGFSVSDLGSQNGTLINGVPLQARTPLSQRDELQLGVYLLRFYDDLEAAGKEGFRGTGLLGPLAMATTTLTRYPSSLPVLPPHARSRAQPQQTVRLGKQTLLRAHSETAVPHNFRLVDGCGGVWNPGAQDLYIGGQGGVPVRRWLRGRVAHLQWDDGGHTLIRTALLARIFVNGRSVWRQRLAPGDRIAIGRSVLRYEQIR